MEKDPIDMHLGGVLFDLRRGRGLSRRTLGAQLGVSAQQIEKYETAQTRISAANLYRLCVYFDIGAERFFDGLVEGREPDFAMIVGLS